MIETATHGRVALVTLNRPDKRNALNAAVCEQLTQAVQAAVDGGARALVLTGAGSSFCAGADLTEVYTDGFRTALYTMLQTVTRAPLPVIAAINGPAIGGGTQLALAADLRVAGPTAVFGIPAAKLGLAVDPWTVRRLAVLAGHGAARSILLAAEQLDVQAALACGLVDRPGTLDDALARAASIADLAPLSVAYAKQALQSLFEPTFDDADLHVAYEACWASEDYAEGRAARAQNRPPVFQGR